MTISRVGAALAAVLLMACGAGSVARPDDPKASEALGDSPASTVHCTTVPAEAEPLVVDWSSSEQLDLSVAMQKSIAVVTYDCRSIHLLKNCAAKGRYAFTAVPTVIEEAVKIRDADEAQASLPFSGGKVGGGVARGASIDIALAYAGKHSALQPVVSAADLSGDCGKATHFVRRATVGAFAMETGTLGQARAAAEIFGVGASGGSSSSKNRLSSAGNIGACRSIKEGAERPPEGCGAVLRLEIAAIGDQAKLEDPKAPLANTCPDGFARGPAGACVKKSAESSYRCDMTDPQECKDQCKKGNAESCFNAGTIADGSEPKPVTLAFYTKACAGNVARGCLAQAKLAVGADWPGAEAAYRKACGLGLAEACKLMAFYVHNSPMKTTWADAVTFNRRACDLGLWEGCKNATDLMIAGAVEGDDRLSPRRDEAVKLLETWCNAESAPACWELYYLHQEGHLSAGRRSDSPKDPAKAALYKKKYCSTKGHKPDLCK